MNKYINSAKEIFYGDRYFRDHVLAPDFDWRAKKKDISPYFASHGFSVSMMYNDYYSRLSEVISDKYVSMDLYYMYILPSLNRRDMQKAYADKNEYSLIFHGIRQPETVLKNRNGFFYDLSENLISKEKAESICLGTRDCIIKPTVETGDGVGVEQFEGSSVDSISEKFCQYGSDFIVQRKVKQHKALARLNPSSLNSMRLMTYRSLDGKINFLSGKTFLRIGGKNSCKDNVSAGGGMMHVDDDGKVCDNIVKYKKMERGSLQKDYDASNFYVPNFSKAIELVENLHKRIWYCDFLGWDVAIGEDGSPVFIEMNVAPACEAAQQGSGPMFEGWILDEIMERVSKVRKLTAEVSLRVFNPGFDHVLQTRGEPYFTR